MLEIDGSQGEGGGQIVRTCLGLSLVTGQPVRICNIRAKRRRPGLQRQHLTAVQAATRVGQARCQGDQLQSTELLFEPGAIQAGEFHLDIGSAGSTSLVLQTVLPALWLASGGSQLRLVGGTHNPLAPPFDFLHRSYLPLVARMGPRCEARLQRVGFYPAGGGVLTVRVEPVATLGPLELVERGPLRRQRVRCLLARLPEHIARRELETWLRLSGWKASATSVELLDDSPGPGNALVAELEYEHVTEVFTEFGKQGVPAEQVARQLYREVQSYLRTAVPVGPHLADQLLLPLAIGAWQGTGGGRFLTGPLTEHTRTHIDLLRRFLGVRIERAECAAGDVLLEVSGDALQEVAGGKAR